MAYRVDPLYSSAAVKALKQDLSAAEFELRAARRDPTYYEPILQAVPKPDARVLDAGCGGGKLTLLLAQRAQYVLGLDISHTLLRLASERQRAQSQANAEWVLGDLHHIPLLDVSFDYIVSSTALHHTALTVTLNRLKQLLVPGGRLYIRDILKPPQNPAQLVFTHIRETMWHVQDMQKMYGAGTALRYAIHRFSPPALRSTRQQRQWTNGDLQTLYAQTFPQCQCTLVDGKILVVWDKPTVDQ